MNDDERIESDAMIYAQENMWPNTAMAAYVAGAKAEREYQRQQYEQDELKTLRSFQQPRSGVCPTCGVAVYDFAGHVAVCQKSSQPSNITITPPPTKT